MSGGDGWLTSYAMGRSGDLFFLVILEKGISAVLHSSHESARKIELGQFYRVLIVRNQKATENHKARHLVTEFHEIEPLAPVRVVNSGGITDVFITTTAQFDGYVHAPSGKNVARFYNDTFGTFIDLNNIVKVTDQLVEFEFKSKSSPLDKTRSVFVPTNVLRYLDAPPRREVHIGLVGVQSKMSRSRFVWARSLDRDVVIDDEFFPSDVDITGRWIEFVVNDQLKVVEPVSLIGDVYETRVVNGIPELRATFEHHGMYQQQFNMFTHEEFGFICDKDCMIPRVEPGGLYRGWIIRHKIDGLNSRWKISIKQDGPELLRREYLPDSRYNETSRPMSRANSNFDDRQDRFEEWHQNGSNSSWSNNDSVPSNYGNNNQRPVLSRSSSPGRHEYFQADRNLPPVSYSERQDHIDEEEDRRSQRSNTYSNQAPLRRPDIAEPLYDPLRRNSPSHDNDGSTNPERSNEAQNCVIYENDVIPARKREVCETPEARKDVNNDAFLSESEEEEHDSPRELNNRTRENLSYLTVRESSTPPCNVHGAGGSDYGTSLQDPSSARADSTSHFTVFELDEEADIRVKYDRMCDIMNYFLQSSSICQQMRLLDVEQYDELVDICKCENKDNL